MADEIKEVEEMIPDELDQEEYIPTQEEVCDAILYDVRDNMDKMSDAQKAYLKSLVDEALQAGTAKERLYTEINDLQVKIEKLDSFLRKRDEDGVRMTVKLQLTEAQVWLMNKQLELEKDLNDVLVARYSIYDYKKGE